MTIPSEPLMIAGDVHGDFERLKRFFDHAQTSRSRIILLGDYINRGPDSKRVLDLLCAEKARRGNELILLRGNHEEALLNFLSGGAVEDFAAHGGLATIKSYLSHDSTDAIGDFIAEFPTDHLNLIRSTDLYYEDATYFLSHAGFNTDNPDDRTARELIHGDQRIFNFAGRWPRPTTVIGHFVQRTGTPLMTGNLLALDTGCGTVEGKPLSVVRLPERRVFQF
jgi:serine/threonine protein phosphatase 1